MQDDGGLSSACNGHGGSYTDAVPEHGGLVVTLVTSTFPTNTSLPALSSSSTGPPFFLIGDAIDMGWGGDAKRLEAGVQRTWSARLVAYRQSVMSHGEDNKQS
jgi:hypothetical protein